MEMWMNSHLLAQIILQERLQERKREPIVLSNFSINFDWLQPIVKGLVGLFL
jgi:hypothetical protein